MAHSTTIQELPKSRIRITISAVAAELLKKSEKKALEEFGKELKLKGFRPGNIPENIVREHANEQYLQLRSLELALPEVVDELIKTKEFRLMGQADVNYESLDPLKIIIEFDIVPELSLGDYGKITVKVDKKTVTDKEVTAAIENLRERLSEYKEVGREAKNGDRVEIDFAGYTLAGAAIPNTESKNHPLILGSNSMIPGFEEAVVGIKKSEEKEFEISFPTDYHAEDMKGKRVKFKISCHKVAEIIRPAADDAFAEKVMGEKKSLDDLKKKITEELQEELDKQAKRATEEQFFAELIKITKGEIPNSMITEEKQAILKELKQRVLYQGLSYEKYLQTVGKSEEELLESYEKQAEERIKLQMALQEISKKEGIEVSDVEIEEQLTKMLARYPEDKHAEVKKQYDKGTQAYAMLQYQLRMQKTLDKILPKS